MIDRIDYRRSRYQYKGVLHSAMQRMWTRRSCNLLVQMFQWLTGPHIGIAWPFHRQCDDAAASDGELRAGMAKDHRHRSSQGSGVAVGDGLGGA